MINSKFIKELYETICEPRSLSLGQGNKGKQINEIIKEILDVLKGKESMLNTLIEEMESLQKMKEIFPFKIDLDLQVKVSKNWRHEDSVISKIIP